jgi:hypothetical protein
MGLDTRTDLPVGMQSGASYLLQTNVVPRIRCAVDSNRYTEKESYCKNSPTSLLYFMYY